ncbi:hypothetical protein, partial [Aeromonas salmonicida]|uniref:hypothetical protein n=1 Tax=Aeromonas salmonicida TaxID=645 RepID=UPI003F7C2348
FTTTAEVEVKVALEFFTKPNIYTHIWSDADDYCKEQFTPSARLPTREELQNLFIQSTSATTAPGQTNFEMCSSYDWPMMNLNDGVRLCGGMSPYYWTSEENDGGSSALIIDMTNGKPFTVFKDNLVHFTCVR